MSKYIHLYCDGASTDNGREITVSAYGVYLKYYDNDELKCDRYDCGACVPISSTNNYALIYSAIMGLRMINDKTLPVTIFSNSQFMKNYADESKHTSYETLKKMFMEEASKFSNEIRFEFVKKADKVSGNVKADRLAEKTAETIYFVRRMK